MPSFRSQPRLHRLPPTGLTEMTILQRQIEATDRQINHHVCPGEHDRFNLFRPSLLDEFLLACLGHRRYQIDSRIVLANIVELIC